MSPKSKPAKKKPEPPKHKATPHTHKGAKMTDPMTVDPQPEPAPEQEPETAPEAEPQAEAPTVPENLTPNQKVARVMNSQSGIVPPIGPNWTPNQKVQTLSRQGQDDVTYPIEGAEPEPPPSGEPTGTATLQWDVQETDTDIALTEATAVTVGSVFLIDSEYMTVNDVSNADNPGVTRATHGSTVAAHTAGTQVSIWEA
jgi:hypothetical protein